MSAKRYQRVEITLDDVPPTVEKLFPLLARLQLVVATEARANDGYRRRSIAEPGGVTNETEPLLDAAGNPIVDAGSGRPIMVPVPQRSDPVAQVVIARDEPRRSPESTALRKVERLIRDAVRALDAAVNIATEAVDGLPDPPENTDGIWCRSHLLVVPSPIHEPVDSRVPKIGLCRRCYDWSREYLKMQSQGALPRGWPALPPPQLLARLATGDLRTERVLHEVLDSIVGTQSVDAYLAWCRRASTAPVEVGTARAIKAYAGSTGT